jgi:DNA-directed RNA polymerase subunit M/transcription elongation factor TFIIS
MIERACPKCSSPLHLQRVDPGMRGFVNRVFECRQCGTEKTFPGRAKPGMAVWKDDLS